MNNIFGFEKSKFSTHKKIFILIIKIIILIIFLLAVIPISIILYGERERKNLMRDYEIPQIFLAKIIALQNMPVKDILKSDEVLVCAVNSYAGVDGLEGLSDAQKKSTPKEILPSEDGLWYLIFFSKTKSKRIYLIENAAIDGITRGSDNCVSKQGSFEVIRKVKTMADDQGPFIITMKNGI